MTDAEIVKMYQQLWDSDTVAAAANISATSVLRIAREAGVTIPPRGRAGKVLRHWDGRQGAAGAPRMTVEEVVAGYRSGLSGPVLAARCGVTAATIYALLRHCGVVLRSPVARRRGRLSSEEE
jgi:hypothetical protein